MIVLQECRFLILNCFIEYVLIDFIILDRVESLVEVVVEQKEVDIVVDEKKFDFKLKI